MRHIKKGKHGLTQFDYLDRNKYEAQLNAQFNQIYYLCLDGKTCAPYPDHIQKKICEDNKKDLK